MIRRILTQETHPPLYALTSRGVLVLSFLCGLAVTGAVLALIALGNARHVQDQTCTIQSRGLGAQHHLTNIMRDVELLLEPVPGVKAQRMPARDVRLLGSLEVELRAYTRVEDEQPTRRVC